MFERIRASGVGALAGLTAYVAWLTGRLARLNDPSNWRLNGPIKWFILVGAVLGLLGGLSLVERWLERERGEVFENAVLNALFVAFIVAIAVLLLLPVLQ